VKADQARLHESSGVQTRLNLKISISNIDLNFIATALYIYLLVKLTGRQNLSKVPMQMNEISMVEIFSLSKVLTSVP